MKKALTILLGSAAILSLASCNDNQQAKPEKKCEMFFRQTDSGPFAPNNFLFSFDELGRLDKMNLYDPNDPKYDFIRDYQYDGDSMLPTGIIRYERLNEELSWYESSDFNIAYSNYILDEEGRLMGYDYDSYRHGMRRYEYQDDKLVTLTTYYERSESSMGVVAEFSYDSNDRLIEVRNSFVSGLEYVDEYTYTGTISYKNGLVSGLVADFENCTNAFDISWNVKNPDVSNRLLCEAFAYILDI